MVDRYKKETFYKFSNETSYKMVRTTKVVKDIEKTMRVREEKRLKFKNRNSNNSKFYEERAKKEVKAYLANEINGEYTGGSKKGRIKDPLKEVLLEARGYCCESCGYSGLNGDGNPNLEIHHINGRDTPRSGFVETHQVLCPTCHSEVTSQARKSFA